MNKITKEFNETSKGLVKVTQIGKRSGQQERALKNVHVANFTELPVMSGLPKDHKSGRKKRAVVNGNVGPVSHLSNILSDVLNPYLAQLNSKIGKTVQNTEELISEFEQFNITSKSDEFNEMFIGSLDVESLYPSLRMEDCAEIVRETMMNSDINLDKIDTNELAILLRKTKTTKELTDKGLIKFIPTKAKSKMNGERRNISNLWEFPENSPSEETKRLMWTEAVVAGIKLLMGNHLYKFDNKIRRVLQLLSTLISLFLQMGCFQEIPEGWNYFLFHHYFFILPKLE